jgi:hypothetical protein
VPELTVHASDATFSGATARARIAAVLDGPPDGLHGAGRILSAMGRVDGHSLCLAASDATIAHGAIGTEEARVLIDLFRDAEAKQLRVLLLLDSAGANVEQGLAALGAFRGVFRAALQARLGGVPMLALLGRSCFGGASMLACLCDARSYLPQTRLATSGPAIIQAADTAATSDPATVDGVIGSVSRLSLHAQDAMREDSLAAARHAARAWVGTNHQRPDMDQQHANLRDRLRQAGVELHAPAEATSAVAPCLAGMLPPGYQPVVNGKLFCAAPPERSRRAVFIGALGGEPIGADDCWRLADWLLAIERTHPGSPVVLVLDARGHAARLLDERLLLSDYLVHLSLTIVQVRRAGHRCVLWIPGEASGASYVAFAGAVERVSALRSARIAVLPGHAVRTILRAEAPTEAQDWLHAGVADAFLDARVAAGGPDSGDPAA